MTIAIDLSNAGHLAVARHFVGKDRYRPELAGVLLGPTDTGKGVRLVATDGYRLSIGIDEAARVVGTWPTHHGNGKGVLVPGGVLEAIGQHCTYDVGVRIRVDERGERVRAEVGGRAEAEAGRCVFPFPAFERVIPPLPLRPATFDGIAVDARLLAPICRIGRLLEGKGKTRAPITFWQSDTGPEHPVRTLLVTLDGIACWRGVVATRAVMQEARMEKQPLAA